MTTTATEQVTAPAPKPSGDAEGWEQRVEAAARAMHNFHVAESGWTADWDELPEWARSLTRRLAAAALTADAALAGQHTTDEGA